MVKSLKKDKLAVNIYENTKATDRPAESKSLWTNCVALSPY